MAKTYRITPFVRISNAIVARALRVGVNLGGTSLNPDKLVHLDEDLAASPHAIERP